MRPALKTCIAFVALISMPALAQVDPLPPNNISPVNGELPSVQSPASTMEEQLDQQVNDPRFQHYDAKVHEPLRLSPDQVERITELEKRYDQEYDRVNRTATPDLNSIEQQRKSDLQLILNPEQFSHWQQMDRGRLQDLPLNDAQPELPDPPTPPNP